MHSPSIFNASVKTQFRSTIAPKWQCKSEPLGIFWMIFHSLVDSKAGLAILNIIPGNNSSEFIDGLTDVDHVDFSSPDRILVMIELALMAVGESVVRNS
jgi:hypothetical protein